MMKAALLHVSYNMWCDHPATESMVTETRDMHVQPVLRCDPELWRECLRTMADAGLNTVLLDLGDAIAYRSHPEIAVSNAWTPAHLRDELARCRDLGLEPLPKLNFSTSHDTWLGPWSRQVSTPAYYGVQRDLIAEVCDLFDGPRFFHLGMDEETARHQQGHHFACMRQGELWWHDLNLACQEARSHGARPWIWADAIWRMGAEAFGAQMPRDVLMSNWFYGPSFHPEPERPVASYAELDTLGFDQVPCGSNWAESDNMAYLHRHCSEACDSRRLLGFMVASWRPLQAHCREWNLAAIRLAGQALAS